MNNILDEAARPARFNTNRSEISKDCSKDQKGSAKTAADIPQQLANSGFDSNQIESSLDKVISNLQQHPWEDGEGWNSSFESAIGPNIDLKPIKDLKPLIDKPAKPISAPVSLLDLIQPTIKNPEKPFAGFPLPGKPIVSQPEVELDDPGLTNFHNSFKNDEVENNNVENNNVEYRDVEGKVFIDSVGNDGVRAELTDIDQGRVANCYLLATLGSIALHNPDYIENMITDNGNGTTRLASAGS